MTHHRDRRTKIEVAEEVIRRRIVADGEVSNRALADVAGVSRALMSDALRAMTAREELIAEGSRVKRTWKRGPKFKEPAPRRATPPTLATGGGRRW